MATPVPSSARQSRLAFIIAVVVLGIAAMGLNGATKFMKLYFKKLPVSLSLPLKEIPSQLGVWKQVFADRPLEADIEHTLGTEDYVFRMYADTRVVPAEVLADVESTDADKRDNALRQFSALESRHPEAFVNMAVTYYTGMVDTVAHIPDRCYVADGFQPTTYDILNWDVAGHGPLTLRYINFEDQTQRGQVSRNVAYFFHVNGAYESDPITGVRMRLQKLTERHGYYAKVELMTQTQDQAKSIAAMQDFLSASLSNIEKCMPDWQKIKADEQAKRS